MDTYCLRDVDTYCFKGQWDVDTYCLRALEWGHLLFQGAMGCGHLLP